MLIALLFVVINLVVDLLYYAVDPRLRGGVARAATGAALTPMARAAPRRSTATCCGASGASPVAVVAGRWSRWSASSRAVLAPWLAPHDPFDLATLNLLDAFKPPAWHGRRRLDSIRSAPTTRGATCCRRSCTARGSRCWSAFASVGAVAIVLGRGARAGGRLSSAARSTRVIMRVADVQLSFPAILIALLIDGVARVALPRERARRDRALRADLRRSASRTGCSTRAPCAARRWSSATRNTCRPRASSACRRLRIMLRHVLPNVLGPVLVIATHQPRRSRSSPRRRCRSSASACRRPSLRSAR